MNLKQIRPIFNVGLMTTTSRTEAEPVHTSEEDIINFYGFWKCRKKLLIVGERVEHKLFGDLFVEPTTGVRRDSSESIKEYL